MARRRISQFKSEQIEEIVQKVLQDIAGPSDGVDTPDGDEPSDGIVMLFDEGQPQREARIAFKINAIDFPTRNALKKYLLIPTRPGIG
jgi:hypothetical protein